jgi:hypothetical protein
MFPVIHLPTANVKIKTLSNTQIVENIQALDAWMLLPSPRGSRDAAPQDSVHVGSQDARCAAQNPGLLWDCFSLFPKYCQHYYQCVYWFNDLQYFHCLILSYSSKTSFKFRYRNIKQNGWIKMQSKSATSSSVNDHKTVPLSNKSNQGEYENNDAIKLIAIDINKTYSLDGYIQYQAQAINTAKEDLLRLRANVLELASQVCYVSKSCSKSCVLQPNKTTDYIYWSLRCQQVSSI